MEFCDEIQSFLEEENSVTIRWISNMLRITLPDVLKLVLKNKQVIQKIASFSYLLTGIDNNGNISYNVAHEYEIDKVRSSLCSIQAETIYAIHRLHSSSYKNELFSSECAQATEILSMVHPSSDFFLSNGIGYITCLGNAIEIRPIGQRILQQSINNKQIVTAITTTSTTSSLVNTKIEAFATIQASVSKVLSTKEKQPDSAPLMRKSKSSIEASSYFSKVPSISSSSSSSPSVISSSIIKVNSIQETTNHTGSNSADTTSKVVEEKKHVDKGKLDDRDDDDDGDDEWESEYKPDPKKLKEINKSLILSKRKSSQEALKLSENDKTEEHNDENSPDNNDKSNGDDGSDNQHELKKHAISNKKSTGQHIHGAMDSYMEDIAIAEYKQLQLYANGELNDDGVSTQQVKRKKRKLVEKLFTDAKGYLITEMVWEEVTDDEQGPSCDVSMLVPSSYKPSKLKSPLQDRTNTTNVNVVGVREDGACDETTDNAAAAQKSKKTVSDGVKDKKTSTASASSKGGKKTATATAAAVVASAVTGKQQQSMMSFFNKKA